MKKLYAAIDLGSHTIRSLVASVDEERGIVTPISHLRDFTRFALTTTYGKESVRIDENSLNKVFKVIERYSEYFNTLGVEKILCGATGVFRKAQNGLSFLNKIEKHFGFPCFIASEDEEAFWSSVGALQILSAMAESRDFLSSRAVFFDLGGSSTEVVFIDRGAVKWKKSFFIGAASLTRDCIPSAPANPVWIDRAVEHARQVFKELVDRFSYFPPDMLIGGGGTASTLGAINISMKEYEPYKICGLRLSCSWVRDLLWKIASLSLEDRKAIPGLEEGREDVIVGGAIIVYVIMDLARKDHFITTDGGFLEGLLIKAIAGERFGSLLYDTSQSNILHSLTWNIKKS